MPLFVVSRRMLMLSRSANHPWLVVAGPDGAGKSAFVAALAARMPIARQEHFRPFASPSDIPVSSPQGRTAYPLPLAVLKILYLFAEQLAAQVPRLLARRSGALVQERGWWDQQIDPIRYRMPPRVSWLVEAMGRLLPKPTLVILLSASPSTIHARKPELPIDEIARQISAWHSQPRRAQDGLLVLDSGIYEPVKLAEIVVDRVRYGAPS